MFWATNPVGHQSSGPYNSAQAGLFHSSRWRSAGYETAGINPVLEGPVDCDQRRVVPAGRVDLEDLVNRNVITP